MPDHHDDLIAELRALGDHLDVAEPADQRAAVRARLARPLPDRPSPLPSVRSVALGDARRAAMFPLRLPAALGTPEEVSLADQNRIVTLTYRGGTVRFDQFDGAVSPVFLKQAPDARWVEIGADTGIWLPGPHAVTYVDRDGIERTATARLAGPTLIWSAGQVTYRLEGLATMAEAVEVARSVA